MGPLEQYGSFEKLRGPNIDPKQHGPYSKDSHQKRPPQFTETAKLSYKLPGLHERLQEGREVEVDPVEC